MYVIPTSQNSYYVNYYGQGYNRPGYSPAAPYPNGGYGYGVAPHNQASSPQIYGNYRSNQLMQPMKLDNALNKSESKIREKITNILKYKKNSKQYKNKKKIDK